jgi:hypothetical protein
MCMTFNYLAVVYADGVSMGAGRGGDDADGNAFYYLFLALEKLL